tara:strand:- start:1370 stop:1555 length:186 start_codon:yes stop_codon:yes gene_type:complete
MNKLKPGEKYIKVAINIGDVDFTFTAFPNPDRTEDNRQPHFKGKNVSAWVNKKRTVIEEVL